VVVTLPSVGGCPAQVSASATLVQYEPGDRISKGAIVFECKSWPNSLFCSQAAFNPPDDLEDSKSDAWKQAWDVIGHCEGTIAPPTAGCPSVWTPGDMVKYKENDLVSVIKSSLPLIQVIYKCKAWPYSWYCGQLSPLNQNGGKLGWETIGECTGTIGPTTSPTFDPLTVIAGCPDDYNLAATEDYVAGDKVSVAIVGSSSHRNVYVCREFPYSGYCNLVGFAPGEQYDYIAWTLLGPCVVPWHPPVLPQHTLVAHLARTPRWLHRLLHPLLSSLLLGCGRLVPCTKLVIKCASGRRSSSASHGHSTFGAVCLRMHPRFRRLGCGPRHGLLLEHALMLSEVSFRGCSESNVKLTRLARHLGF
jgi:hypothetical protein